MFLHYSVYVLRLSNGDYYVGRSNNIERRLKEHYSGQQKTTKKFLPLTVETIISFKEKSLVFNFERYLKSESGIAFRKKHLVQL